MRALQCLGYSKKQDIFVVILIIIAGTENWQSFHGVGIHLEKSSGALMKGDTNSLIARSKENPILLTFMVILTISIGVMVALAVVLFQNSQKDQEYLQLVSNLRASSYQLNSLSRDSTAGNENSFGQLQRLIAGMDRTWTELQSTDDETRFLLSAQFSAYEGVWTTTRANANKIIKNQETIVFLHQVATTLNEAIPQLQSELDNIVDILIEDDAPAEQVAEVRKQTWRSERIARNIEKMLQGGDGSKLAADQFYLDASLFGKVLVGMQQGDIVMGIEPVSGENATGSLSDITELFALVSGQVKQIYEASPELDESGIATNAILTDNPRLLAALSAVNDQIVALPSSRRVNSTVLAALAALGLISMLVSGVIFNQGTKVRLKETAETNDRNQHAILRLLDELGDLADGDLTTTATVTEDFTGAIADSINYTIDQLRILVSRINETSERVVGSSRDTQQTALHLAEAAEHQAQEIAGASAAINEMAVTIDQVSANAAESAGVAERSVSIANNGAKVVQNTIRGMDIIREQIQDTSKRIKRLGESSQEIGDIVGLINDIADQTNILALNAAIQASMAGDAGRGFAVVADEVQRLAERSATATKQIESLVKTIQNDTNEAVISMEQTTSEVVRGARLAQDAGVALEEIETVSANLAELIQNISNAARQQASSAGHISNTMNVIQEITSQTSAGTNATAKSIGTLAELASELRDSVAGFTLPEEITEEGNTVDVDESYEGYEGDDALDVAVFEEDIVDLEDDLLGELEDESESSEEDLRAV
ncbi:MAG: twitching motility protein PilJ [Flavobacteriales bacterium]|jgi:twitching motility protein PilJ